MTFRGTESEFMALFPPSNTGLLPHRFRVVVYTGSPIIRAPIDEFKFIVNFLIIVLRRVIFCGFFIAEMKSSSLFVSAMRNSPHIFHVKTKGKACLSLFVAFAKNSLKFE